MADNTPAPMKGAKTESKDSSKPMVRLADMSDELQQSAQDIAVLAFEEHTLEKDRAQYIKKEMDRQHGQTWHCIVGKNFGSYVTHETGNFIYFYLNSAAILLFKSG